MMLYTVRAAYRGEINPDLDRQLNELAGFDSSESGYFLGDGGERDLEWFHEDLGLAQTAFYAMARVEDIQVDLVVSHLPEGWFPEDMADDTPTAASA